MLSTIQWRPVVSYEQGYEVSNDGRVRSNYMNGKERALTVSKYGYPKLTLKQKGRKTACFEVHRLVALAFIPNPLGLPQVNHIDGNKANNTVANLEWCTAEENSQHAVGAGLLGRYTGGSRKGKPTGRTGARHGRSRPVLAVAQAAQPQQFQSASDAAKSLGLPVATVTWGCRKGKTVGNVSLSYASSQC